jgi:Protein of unknown function (DUF4197)
MRTVYSRAAQLATWSAVVDFVRPLAQRGNQGPTGDTVMRTFTRYCGAVLLGALCGTAIAAQSAVDALTSKDATGGLRAALSQGIDIAVTQLGTPNGFLNDPKVAIPLPPTLEKAERALRMVGMGGEADQLKATMNHAAEQAVAQAKPIFKQALQRMTLADAKGILTGGEDAGTQYFRRATSDQLGAKFEPIVARETAKLRLGSLYDQYAGKAASVGLINKQEANLNGYVTEKALDGLFSRIADEERTIRQNPIGQANSLIKKVFGALDH